MLPGHAHNPRGTQKTGLIGDRARIIIMGVMLGVIVLAYLLPDRTGQPDKNSIVRPPRVDVSAFEPDPEILAEIRDATATERAHGFLARAWEELIRKSYNIGPAIAAALLLPKQAADVSQLRGNPGAYRGRYIWVKGRLETFAEQKIHPIPRAKSYKGRLRTASGDQVIFWVSNPLPESVRNETNPWVRVEGYFAKIVDVHLDPPVLEAPMLIGPRVEKAFPGWEPVRELDPKILARVKNGVFVPETDSWIHTNDMATLLVDSQDEPLWHMAAYAIHESERKKDSDERHSEIFELKEQYTRFKLGKYEIGAPLRVRGAFVQARVYRAKVNPVGIEHWTSAWVRIPRMGAKMVPIWIPEDIGEWRFGDSVDIDAYYFKNRAYQAQDYSVVHTPQFVAARLSRFRIESHPITMWIGLVFALIAMAITLLFFNMNRSAKRESEEYKSRLVDRRRRRRAAVPGKLHAET